MWRMPVTIKSCCMAYFPFRNNSVLNGINRGRRGRFKKKILFVMKVLLSLSEPSD